MTGILIQRSFKNARPLPLQYATVAGLAVLSHGVLDRLARATYHPAVPLLNDWFWILTHLTMASLTVLIVIKFWRGHWLAMMCSVLPDFDWILRPVGRRLFAGYGEQAPLHALLGRFIDLLVQPNVWDLLPHWNLARKGLLVEVALFTVLVVSTHVLRKQDKGVRDSATTQ